MAESFSVKAILSAADKGFKSTMKAASGYVDNLKSTLTSGIGFGVMMAAGQKAFEVVSNSVTGLIGDMNDASAAWKTFEGNMEMNGKTKKEIKSIKKELQDFAEATIYSSSDMASTFAQLEAVGTKNTTKLVKGFGGLAAAAENPTQAMKTLSQQATQMAAKPKVAWEDFKLMLEQTPAGIAAVAKEMGMSTQDMIKNVQDGKIATEDFFDAIAKVGTNDAFTKLATEYKTVGQAMDGLQETMANKLQPAFGVLSDIGIGAISKLVDKMGELDGEKIAAKLTSGLDKIKPYWDTFVGIANEVGSAFGDAFSAISRELADLNGEFGSTESVEGFGDAIGVAGDALKTFAGFLEDNAGTIALLIKNLPKLLAAYMAFKSLSSVISIIKSFHDGISVAQTALKAFNIVGTLSKLASLGPIIGIVAGIAAAIAGVVLVVKNWGAITEWFGNLWKTVCTAIQNAWETVCTAVKNAWTTLTTSISNTITTIQTTISTGWTAITTAIGNAMTTIQTTIQTVWNAILSNPIVQSIVTTVQSLFQNMVTTLQGIWNGLVSIASGAWKLLKNTILGPVLLLIDLVTGDFDQLKSDAQNIWNNMKDAASKIWAGIKQVVSSLAEGLVNGVKTGITGLKNTLSTIWTAMKNTASSIWNSLKSSVTNSVNTLKQAISNAWTTIKSTASNTWNNLKSSVVNIANSLKQSAVNAFKSLVSGIRNALGSLGSVVKNGFQSAISYITSLPGKAISWGRDFINGLKDGIMSGVQGIINAVKGIGDKIRSFLHFSRPDKGPLRDYETWMPDMVKGLAQGIVSSMPILDKAVNRISCSVSEIGNSSGWVSDTIKGIRNGYSRIMNSISIPNLNVAPFEFAYCNTSGEGMDLNDDYDYNRKVYIYIEVPVDVDGREIAKASAEYMEEELNKRETRANRKRGSR